MRLKIWEIVNHKIVKSQNPSDCMYFTSLLPKFNAVINDDQSVTLSCQKVNQNLLEIEEIAIKRFKNEVVARRQDIEEMERKRTELLKIIDLYEDLKDNNFLCEQEEDLKITNMIIRNHHQELKRIKLQCSQEFEYYTEKSEYKIHLEVNKLVKVTNLPDQYNDFYLMLLDESSIPSSLTVSEITKTREFDKLSEEDIQGIFSRDVRCVATFGYRQS